MLTNRDRDLLIRVLRDAVAECLTAAHTITIVSKPSAPPIHADTLRKRADLYRKLAVKLAGLEVPLCEPS